YVFNDFSSISSNLEGGREVTEPEGKLRDQTTKGRGEHLIPGFTNRSDNIHDAVCDVLKAFLKRYKWALRIFLIVSKPDLDNILKHCNEVVRPHNLHLSEQVEKRLNSKLDAIDSRLESVVDAAQCFQLRGLNV